MTNPRLDEEIQRLLGETDVYRKYGLHAKALEHIQHVFELQPRHLGAHEKLAEIFVESGRADDALAKFWELYQYAGPSEAGARYLREILRIEPTNAEARSILNEIGAEFPSAPVEWEALEDVIDLGDEAVMEEESQAGYIVGEPSGTGTYEVAPVEPTSLTPEGREYTAENPDGQEFAPRSLEGGLEDADYYAQQGMLPEAQAILEELLLSYPGHPLIQARLHDIAAVSASQGDLVDYAQDEVEQPPSYPPRIAAPIEPGRQGFGPGTHVTSVSIDAPPTDAPPPAADAAESAEADFHAHLELGTAYREMGLLDDAIAELQAALRMEAVPTREVACRMVLGRCFVERGRVIDGISQFKNALYVESIADSEELALYYDLGLAYEQLGDGREALYYFEKVAKRAPGYQDVEQRLAVLQSRRSP